MSSMSFSVKISLLFELRGKAHLEDLFQQVSTIPAKQRERERDVQEVLSFSFCSVEIHKGVGMGHTLPGRNFVSFLTQADIVVCLA